MFTCAAARPHVNVKQSNSFVKYHGLGNDFIVIDNTLIDIPVYTQSDAVKLCNRNFGIGADGVIFALRGKNGCHYTMRIYNSDGSEPEMCGNGVRCLAKFLMELESCSVTDGVTIQLGKQRDSYRIWTNAGIVTAVISRNGDVLVDMGEPIFQAGNIPTLLTATTTDGAVVDTEVEISEGVWFKISAVGMGNPHAVVFVDGDLDSTITPPFEVAGPLVENCLAAFPEKVNAEFVQVISRNHLNVYVWERGSGRTLACGTGACAACVAAVLTGRADRNCTVSLPGGDLKVHWRQCDNRVLMSGPAELVFRGTIDFL